MRWMQSWTRYWLAIDIIGLGGGGALAFWYYISNVRVGAAQASAALDTLWANVATEILGVWLSVRIIDAIVRRRDRGTAVRQQVAADLQYIAERAEAVLEGDVRATDDLREALDAIDEPNPERTAALTDRESALMEHALGPARRLWNLGLDLLNLTRVADAQLQRLPPDSFPQIRQELAIAMPLSWENVFSLRLLVDSARAAPPDASTLEVLGTLRELVNVAATYKRTLNEVRHWERPARYVLTRM